MKVEYHPADETVIVAHPSDGVPHRFVFRDCPSAGNTAIITMAGPPPYTRAKIEAGATVVANYMGAKTADIADMMEGAMA